MLRLALAKNLSASENALRTVPKEHFCWNTDDLIDLDPVRLGQRLCFSLVNSHSKHTLQAPGKGHGQQ